MKKLIIAIILICMFQTSLFASDRHKHRERKGHTKHGKVKGYDHCKDGWKVKCKKYIRRSKYKKVRLCVNKGGDVGEEDDKIKECTIPARHVYYENSKVPKVIIECYLKGTSAYNRGYRSSVQIMGKNGQVLRRQRVYMSGARIIKAYNRINRGDNGEVLGNPTYKPTDKEVKEFESYIK